MIAKNNNSTVYALTGNIGGSVEVNREDSQGVDCGK